MDLRSVLIQAVTEFFPVSSSAHLFLFSKGSLAPELLHFGTIITVIVYFRKELWKHIFTVCIGSIPAIALGYMIKTFSVPLYEKEVIKWGFLLGTLFMIFAEFTTQTSKTKVSFKDAFLVGLMQCFAFIPGFSRLGATLSAARILGYNRSASATFSFLLSIPVSLGALVLSNTTLNTMLALSPYIALEVVVGYLALMVFMKCNSQLLMLALAFYRMFIFYMMF